MAIDISDQTHEERVMLVGSVLAILQSSAFAKRATWPACVVELGERRATSRGCFAAWLRSHALDVLARECAARKTKPGEVLVYVSADSDAVACAGFFVLDVASELARLRAA